MIQRPLKACIFVDDNCGTPSEEFATLQNANATLRAWLNFYIAGFATETGIRPFQLQYRDFDVYLVDFGGYSDTDKQLFVANLVDIMIARPSRLYLFWTGESWEAFRREAPRLAESPGCINCCEPDALEKIEKYLLDMQP